MKPVNNNDPSWIQWLDKACNLAELRHAEINLELTKFKCDKCGHTPVADNQVVYICECQVDNWRQRCIDPSELFAELLKDGWTFHDTNLIGYWMEYEMLVKTNPANTPSPAPPEPSAD